jgi:predicted DNA-binding transcriptional regulator AlpA
MGQSFTAWRTLANNFIAGSSVGFCGTSLPAKARRLGKTLRTVDNWMSRGRLPYYKIGRSVEFRWSEAQHHLAQTTRVSRYCGQIWVKRERVDDVAQWRDAVVTKIRTVTQCKLRGL